MAALGQLSDALAAIWRLCPRVKLVSRHLCAQVLRDGQIHPAGHQPQYELDYL